MSDQPFNLQNMASFTLFASGGGTCDGDSCAVEPASQATAIACNLDAIPADQRERHAQLAARVNAATRVEALEAGYRLHLNADALVEAAEWVSLERLCCPFLRFNLEATAEGVSLSLTGGEGVKAFIAAEMGLAQP